MKELNKKECLIMRNALSIKQMEEIIKYGKIFLDKQDMIKRLKESIEEIQEIVLKNLDNLPEEFKELRDKMEINSKIHLSEERGLLKKLESDDGYYLVGFGLNEESE